MLSQMYLSTGLLAKYPEAGKIDRKLQFDRNISSYDRNSTDHPTFFNSARSKKAYLASNFGVDRFVAFMTYANNVMNSRSGNVRLNRFTRAFTELFNSDGLTAFNVFYTLSANFWTVVDAVANVVRVGEGRIKDQIEEEQAANEPDPLEELRDSFDDTNNNLADVSNLVRILACDPNGGADFIPSECLERGLDGVVDEETNDVEEEPDDDVDPAQEQAKMGQKPALLQASLPTVSLGHLRAQPHVLQQAQSKTIPQNQRPINLPTRAPLATPRASTKLDAPQAIMSNLVPVHRQPIPLAQSRAQNRAQIHLRVQPLIQQQPAPNQAHIRSHVQPSTQRQIVSQSRAQVLSPVVTRERPLTVQFPAQGIQRTQVDSLVSRPHIPTGVSSQVLPLDARSKITPSSRAVGNRVFDNPLTVSPVRHLQLANQGSYQVGNPPVNLRNLPDVTNRNVHQPVYHTAYPLIRSRNSLQPLVSPSYRNTNVVKATKQS